MVSYSRAHLRRRPLFNRCADRAIMKATIRISLIVIIAWAEPAPKLWGATPWSTGAALQKALDESVDVILSEAPMRQALESWARNKNVAVLLDRRIDPGRKVEISLRQSPLKNVFQAIAQKSDSGLSMVGPVAYFAPPETARTVRTLVALRREDARGLSPAAEKKFRDQKPIAWDDLVEPRDLLQKTAGESGVQVAGLDRVPHDLWAAADLPPLELIERLTLIAGQYDLTFQIGADGKRITLVPIPKRVEIERKYPAGRQAQETVQRYASFAPQARIEVQDEKILVAGTIEDHERITSPSSHTPAESTSKSAPVDLARKRFTLTVTEQPVGPVLGQLAHQLDLDLKMDPKAIQDSGVSLDQRVSFNVKNATIDELLRAAISQTGLKFTRKGNVVQIEPSQEK
jgi:hypothetical protein